MKRLFLIVAAAAAGVWVWRKVEAERDGRELWNEVTDPVPNSGN